MGYGQVQFTKSHLADLYKKGTHVTYRVKENGLPDDAEIVGVIPSQVNSVRLFSPSIRRAMRRVFSLI